MKKILLTILLLGTEMAQAKSRWGVKVGNKAIIGNWKAAKKAKTSTDKKGTQMTKNKLKNNRFPDPYRYR